MWTMAHRAVLSAAIAGACSGVAVAVPPPSYELQELVTGYFQSTSATMRADIAERIERRQDATLASVAEAIGRVELWNAQPPGMQRMTVRSAAGRETEVTVHVPAGYDPARAYPMLLALHGQGGSGSRYIQFAMRLLADRVNEFIVAAPTDYVGCWLGSTEEESRTPSAILEALKRRFHIDTDRVYVNGYSMGGHGSFLHAVLHTDYFAAAIPLAGSFMTQVGYEAVELMLPNVRHVPMLVVWGELDREDRFKRYDAKSGISGANRHVRRVAKRLGIPIKMVELPGVRHGGVTPPADDFAEMLRRVRPHAPKEFTHWFRYADQGRMAWLRQTQYQGKPWRGREFVVRPKNDEDYSEAALRTIERKLALLRGRIEGQTIHVETRKCKEIELRLHDGLVDLDREVTILYKGREVFRGSVKRQIRTLLAVAHADWDFQRLFPVRLRITRTGDTQPF